MKAKIKYFTLLIMLGISVACAEQKQGRVCMQTFYEKGYWGYDIVVNGKICIHQDYIPAIIGNKRFADKKDAELVGRLVLKKILNKETPTVNTGELRQLDIKGTS